MFEGRACLVAVTVAAPCAAQGMTGAIDMAKRVVGEREGAYMLQQFESEANPEVHYRTTGPEIWRDTAGTIDVLVAGAPSPSSPLPLSPPAHMHSCLMSHAHSLA